MADVSGSMERTTSYYDAQEGAPLPIIAKQLQTPAPALEAEGTPGLRDRFLEKATESVRTAIVTASNESGRTRDDRLERLFRELSLPIDDAVGEKLRGSSAAVEGLNLRFPSAHYYALLASYYYERPAAYEALYRELVPVWANVHLPILFAALAYRAVFAHETEHSLKDLNEVKKGANRLFWIDLQRSTLIFFPLYKYLREEILFSTEHWSKAFVQRSLLSIYRMAVRFHLYYEPASLLSGLITKVNQRVADWLAKGGAPNSLMDQSLSDIAGAEIAEQLHLIKNNDVLLTFLRGCVVLKELRFSEVATPLKIQAVLYNMSAPGGPFYAPREVRSAAYHTLKTLYPKGKLVRNIVYALFRMLHPYYALSSILHHLAVLFWAFVAYVAFWRRMWPRKAVAV